MPLTSKSRSDETDLQVGPRVIVDDVEPEGGWQPPSGGLLAVVAVVVVALLVLLPGEPTEQASPTTLVSEVLLPADEWAQGVLPGSGALRGVAIGSDRMVAVGDGPQFWWSDNGVRWQLAPRPEGRGDQATAVARLADEYVAVGGGSDDTAMAWVSDAGTEWEPIPIAAPAPSLLTGIVAKSQVGMADGPRAVAWGWSGSSNPFDPQAAAMLWLTRDGRNWTELTPPEPDAYIARVQLTSSGWLVMGAHIGKPALWTSPDLETWDEVTNDGLPFGRAMVELDEEQGWTAILSEIQYRGRSTEWRLNGAWELLDSGVGSSGITAGPEETVNSGSQVFGVGPGTLWERSGDDWEAVEVEGEVFDLDSNSEVQIAVGGQPSTQVQQPSLWVRGGTEAPAGAVTFQAGSRWRETERLGEGRLQGAWPVAGGWVVVTDSDWWRVTATSIARISNPPNLEVVGSIVKAGTEWVTLPQTYWTSDGAVWERRPSPWEDGYVQAMSEVDGSLRAIGGDGGFVWSAKESSDGGFTWRPLNQPQASVPLWDLQGVEGGFLGTIARPRGGRDVVFGEDGQSWETVTSGSILPNPGLPVAVTGPGELLLLDRNQTITAPHTSPASVTRWDERIVLVANQRLWIGPDPWGEFPLTADRGVGAGWVIPIPDGDRLRIVGEDRGAVFVYEWDP